MRPSRRYSLWRGLLLTDPRGSAANAAPREVLATAPHATPDSLLPASSMTMVVTLTVSREALAYDQRLKRQK